MPVTSMRGWRTSLRAATIRSPSGASPRVSLSGLPGVTSHHTRSSASRFMAIRQASRWASCGGSKVPPNRPIRMPEACGGNATRSAGITRPADREAGNGRSRPDLPAAADAVFEAGELIDPDRPAGVKAAGGNADLGAETELAAVGELGGGVVQHDRGIDLAQEFVRRGAVAGDDGIGVMGAVAIDM